MSEAELAAENAVPCPDCNGSGYARVVDWDDPGYTGERDELCVRCDGHGQIALEANRARRPE